MKSCSRLPFRRITLALVVLSLGVLLASCADFNFTAECDDCQSDPGFTPRTSPDGLLNFLCEAYEARNMDAYGEALHECYEFEFTDDVADDLSLPRENPSWGKAEDVMSTRNMFNDPDVVGIEIHLDPFGAESDWEDCWHEFICGDPPETTLIQGLCRLFEPEIKIYVEELGEEERILWVHRSLLDIMVTPDPEQEGLWVILRIKETEKNPFIRPQVGATVGGSRTLVSTTDPFSWGSIKALYREQP